MAMNEAQARAQMQAHMGAFEAAFARGAPTHDLDAILRNAVEMVNQAGRDGVAANVCDELYQIQLASRQKLVERDLHTQMRAFEEAFADGAQARELDAILLAVRGVVSAARHFGIDVEVCNDLALIQLAAELELAKREGNRGWIDAVNDAVRGLAIPEGRKNALFLDERLKRHELRANRDEILHLIVDLEMLLENLERLRGTPNFDPHIKDAVQARILGAKLFVAEMNLHAKNIELLPLLLDQAKLEAEIAAVKVQIAMETDAVKVTALERHKTDLERQLANFQRNHLDPRQAEQTRLRDEFKQALTAAEKHHELCIDRPAKQRLGERILCMKLNAAADDLRAADEAILGTLQQVAASRAAIEAATLVHGSESLRQSQLKAHQALLTLLKAQQKTRLQHCNTIDKLSKEIAAYPRNNARDATVLNAASAVLLGEQIQLLQNNTAEIEFCHRKLELLLPSIEVAAVRVEQLQAEIATKSTPSAKLQKELEEAKEKLHALSSTAEALLARLRELRGNETELNKEYKKIDDAVVDKLKNELHYENGSPEKKALDRAWGRKSEAKSRAPDDEQRRWDDLCDNHSSMSEPAPTITSELQIRAEFAAWRLLYTTRAPAEIARSGDLYDRYVEMLRVLRPSETAERDVESIARNMMAILGPKTHRGAIEGWCQGDSISRTADKDLAKSEVTRIARQRHKDSHGAVTLTVVAVGEKFYVAFPQTKADGTIICDSRALLSYINDQLKMLSARGTSLQDREILDNIALALRSAAKEPGYKGNRVEEAVNAAIISRCNELGIDYPQERDPTVGPAASVIDAMAMPTGAIHAPPVVLSAEVPFTHLRRGLLAGCYDNNFGVYPERVPRDPSDPHSHLVVSPIKQAVDAVLDVTASPKQAALVDALEFRPHDRIDGYAITERKATKEKPAAIILEQGEGANKATITFKSAVGGTHTTAEVRSKNRAHEVAATAVAAKHLAGGVHNRAVSVDLSSVKRSSLVYRLFGHADRANENLNDQASYLQGILNERVVPVLEPYASSNAHTAVWNTYKALLSMDKKIGGGSDLAGDYLDVVCDRNNEELKDSLIDRLLAETGEVYDDEARIRHGIRGPLYTKAELMAGQDSDGHAIDVQAVIKAQAIKDSKAIKGDRNFIAPQGPTRPPASVTPDPDDDGKGLTR